MHDWNQMGVRERLFAAYKALMRGQSIQYAIDRASYNPRTDRISFGHHNDLSISIKVSQEGEKSVQDIRALFPNLFSSDQAVLNAVAINDESQCELGCGQKPHPGRACQNSYDDLRPVSGEDRYVEWDDEFDCWGVFGTESGFCYSQHDSEEDAERSLK